jgi:hypothetical protein
MTFSTFGVNAVDLGFPVEHNGKLLLLFGDTWPASHAGDQTGEISPDDSVGVTQRQAPPTGPDQGCLDLQFHANGKVFVSPAVVSDPGIRQGLFNVPASGVSVDGALYAAFWTDHCANPTQLDVSPDDPLQRPPPRPPGADDPKDVGCPETDLSNSLGRAVLARSDDEALTFSQVADMPIGFAYPVFALAPGASGGVYVFGVPRYRTSIPYLAYAPSDGFADPATWRYFSGRDAAGQPRWVSLAEWSGQVDQRSGFKRRWRPPGEAEVFTARADADRCIGEFSVTWNKPLALWLMLYNCGATIEARVAPAPWGPWSDPTPLLAFDDSVTCELVMPSAGCGQTTTNAQAPPQLGDRFWDYWPSKYQNNQFEGGGFYAPFVLDRYTSAASGAGRAAIIYWLVSTWNPYEVTLMRTTLREVTPPTPVGRIKLQDLTREAARPKPPTPPTRCQKLRSRLCQSNYTPG